eukprot:2310626-Amphidinium_carterae.3
MSLQWQRNTLMLRISGFAQDNLFSAPGPWLFFKEARCSDAALSIQDGEPQPPEENTSHTIMLTRLVAETNPCSSVFRALHSASAHGHVGKN